jgi:hypothetical protein
MVHLISYDLNGRESSQGYADVKRLITENAIEYRHVLYSGWLVYTNNSPKDWHNALSKVVDQNDRFIVSQLHGSDWGSLDREVHVWLVGKV